MNACAYPALNGINNPSPRDYQDVDFTYPYDKVLTANQTLKDEAVAIHTDSDFCFRSFRVSHATGAFQIRWNDSQGYYLSAGPLYSGNFLSGGVPWPFVIHPEFIFPAGSRIGIEITDLSGFSNTIELLFEGAKRYRLQR